MRIDELGGRLPIVRDLKRVRSELETLRAARIREYLDRLLAGERYADPRRLARHEAQVFSQGGEDGTIAEIFRRIGTASRTFLEIGVGDGLENNTTFLLWQGWSGWWVEGNGEYAARIRGTFRAPLAEGKLTLIESFVRSGEVAGLLERHHVPAEHDLFSLDIDRNTYWAWAALGKFRPRAAVIEYNASIPPEVDWKVEDRPERAWNGSVYFGAGLKALENLGRELGYSLVGCGLTGANAFFVRDDLVGDRFAPPYTAENHYEPPRYFLARRQGHPAGFSDD